MLIFLTLACEVNCPEGQVPAPVGRDCLNAADHPETVEEGLALLPSCEPLTTGVALDWDEGCANEICSTMTYDEIVAAVGEGECGLGDEDDLTFCRWYDDTVGVFFYGQNGDWGDDIASLVHVDRAFQGSSPEGFGMDVSARCFLDEFGEPIDIDAPDQGRGTRITELRFEDPDIWVEVNPDNGRVDGLTLGGLD